MCFPTIYQILTIIHVFFKSVHPLTPTQLDMNFIQLMIKSLTILTYQFRVFSTHLVMPLNETLNEAVFHSGECIFEIIKKHFKSGTVVGTVMSGLQNYTLPNLSNDTPEQTFHNLMRSESWSMVVQQRYNSRSTMAKVYGIVYIIYNY